MGENLEKLVKVVQEEHAKSLLKLYTKIIEYKDYLEKQGYEDNFNNLAETLAEEINLLLEE